MAYQQIVTVNISLQTAGISRASFGVPIFITDHMWFTERSRSYINIESVAEDVPTDSDAYLGAKQAFSQDVPPKTVKLGRREADDIEFTPNAVSSIGQEFSIVVVGTDGVAINASFVTVTGSETAADITDALDTALSGIVGVTVTDGTGTLTLSPSSVEDFAITMVKGLSYEYTTTETAADMLSAITAEDDEFYFLGCNDHTDSFVMDLASEVEARTKIYFVSLQEVTNLGSYSEAATDTFSKLKQNGYFRTSAWFHHEADSKFVEMQYASVIAPADAGKKVVANNKVTEGASKNTTTGLSLSTTEKGNLVAKSANFTEVVGGVTITRRGMVCAGEWIDVIRNRDFLEARITEAYQSYMINRPVIPYTDTGINNIKAVLSAVLDRYVETETSPNILQKNNPYTINFSRRADISTNDVAAREFNGSFIARLSGAIQINNITGALIYDGNA